MHVLIIGEHPLFNEGLSSLLRRLYPDVRVSIETASLSAAISMQPADLIFVDLGSAPTQQDMKALSELVSDMSMRVVVLGDKPSPSFSRAIMNLNVAGFIPKNMELQALEGALRLIEMKHRYLPDTMLLDEPSGFAEAPEAFIGARKIKLTQRQLEVLGELGKGRTNNQISDAFGIAVATVKLHVNAVMKALGAGNRTEAVIIASQLGLLPLEGKTL